MVHDLSNFGMFSSIALYCSERFRLGLLFSAFEREHLREQPMRLKPVRRGGAGLPQAQFHRDSIVTCSVKRGQIDQRILPVIGRGDGPLGGIESILPSLALQGWIGFM